MKNHDPEKLKRFDAINKISRENAQQGEFFMANVVTSTGLEIPHPVFIIGKHKDSNDEEDVIACLCTHYYRNSYDIAVKLRDPSFVRTNKIFLIGRHQLIHKLKTPEINEIQIGHLKGKSIEAIN